MIDNRRVHTGVLAVALAVAGAALNVPSARAQCCGDCDNDRRITVDELVTAVNHALQGCPALQTPMATATATLTPTPVATATGTPTRFVDSGDGTIADQESGLVWEKKIALDGSLDGFNLHDADNRYPWVGNCSSPDGTSCQSDEDCKSGSICRGDDQQRTNLTVFTWLAQVNMETGIGFAGFSDWRIPTIDELRTLRDLDTPPPTIDAVFKASECGTRCLNPSSPGCSCTSPDPYWSATEFALDPSRAWRVSFADGAVIPNRKLDDLRVRAVRGGT